MGGGSALNWRAIADRYRRKHAVEKEVERCPHKGNKRVVGIFVKCAYCGKTIGKI